MKTNARILIVMLLFTSISFLYGQQPAKTTRLLVMQDVVYPYKVDAYEKAQKDMNDFIAKNYPAVKWNCLQYDNYTYIYTVDLGDYGKIDEMNKMWQEKMKTVNQDDFKKYADQFLGTISQTNQLVVTKDDKGSYKAKDPYIKRNEAKFFHWDYFELIPGKEDDAVSIAREEAAYSEKMNLKMDYNLWRVSMGQNTNSIIFVSWDKDRVNFFTDMEKDNKLAGKEMEDMDKRFMTYVQKFEHWNGKPRPDLSIMDMSTANK
ncbi:MAG: hypothetical protein P4L27_01770 [Ignavibacteriaceae bacterium]|nr:hypothetical protein [Ignavibacteriaceae bacterium]